MGISPCDGCREPTRHPLPLIIRRAGGIPPSADGNALFDDRRPCAAEVSSRRCDDCVRLRLPVAQGGQSQPHFLSPSAGCSRKIFADVRAQKNGPDDRVTIVWPIVR